MVSTRQLCSVLNTCPQNDWTKDKRRCYCLARHRSKIQSHSNARLHYIDLRSKWCLVFTSWLSSLHCRGWLGILNVRYCRYQDQNYNLDISGRVRELHALMNWNVLAASTLNGTYPNSVVIWYKCVLRKKKKTRDKPRSSPLFQSGAACMMYLTNIFSNRILKNILVKKVSGIWSLNAVFHVLSSVNF